MRKKNLIHSGEILQEEFLTPMGISQTRLAPDIRVHAPRVNATVRGKRAITADPALRLGQQGHEHIAGVSHGACGRTDRDWSGGREMMDVRITVIRKASYPDLMAKYENPIEHACTLSEGQRFVSVDAKCPSGLCPEAWTTLAPFVKTLAEGGGDFFDGWMKNPKSAMLSCNDGFRPVSFLVETMGESGEKG